jgi:cell division protein FtsI/penicillin-binding protein 2
MIDLNLEHITNRNKDAMNRFIEEYNLKFSYEDIVNGFTTMYITTDSKNQRIQLIGNQRYYDIDEDGRIYYQDERKTKKVQIYVLKKIIYENLTEEQRDEVKNDLEAFKNLHLENLLIKNLVAHENIVNYRRDYNIIFKQYRLSIQ